MRKVGKATAVALLAPMAAATIAALSSPAEAAGDCPILSAPKASITPPSGTITAGSTVPVKAVICGMLLKAHLQISGPGIDQQVGQAVNNGTVQENVKVPKPGYFTLSVIGNATGHTYATDGFSVQARPMAAVASPKTASKAPSPAGAGNAAGGNPFKLPRGAGGVVPNAGGAGNVPLNESSPFSLPSVAPDGAGVQYPTPDPEVAAAPTAQPQARNVASTTPVSWGQSIAVALVLLMLSAHFGMLSRRQRLAAEGARGGSGPSGGRSKGVGGRKTRKKATAAASTAAATTAPAFTAGGVSDLATDAAAPAGPAPADDWDTWPNARLGMDAPPQAIPAVTATTDDPSELDDPQSARHGYRGRRRRA